MEAYGCVLGIKWAENPGAPLIDCQGRDAAGAHVDSDSSSWWTSAELKRLTWEAPKQGWDGAIAELQDFLVRNPADLADAEWDFVARVQATYL